MTPIVAAALVGAGAGLVGSAFNSFSTSKVNQANINAQKEINDANIRAQKEINQSQLDYAKMMTQQQWERDDNAHQREVADLISAGLSPLANTAGSQVTSAQSFNPQSEAVAQAYQAQAPQFDINPFISSIQQGMDISERMKEHQDKMVREDNSLFLRSEEIANTLASIKVQDKSVEAQITKISNDYAIACQNVELAKAQLEYTKDIDNRRLILEKESENSRMINESLRKSLGDGFHTKAYTDWNTYCFALEDWGKKWNIFLQTELSKESSVSHSETTGKSRNGSIGANAGTFGSSLGGSLSSGGSNMSGTSSSASLNSNYERAKMLEFTSRYPRPEYIYTIK